ncbi:MAG: dihydroorotase [Bacteroidaceae bacterium]|nr:dihydroorotase [Bacteroidaceae bacterium]
MRTEISNVTIVNEGKKAIGSVIINGSKIVEICTDGKKPCRKSDEVIDGSGMYLIPGVIDDHVHFREPGLTHKACILSETRAAAAGGVTSFMEMPNTRPATTTISALHDKFHRAAKDSRINYSFYFGATNNNSHLFEKLNPHRICGIKLFMGSSTGNMLVDESDGLNSVFSRANMPIAVHCEDTDIITTNAEEYRKKYGEDIDIKYHPLIRSEEACYKSLQKAVALAEKHDKQLHILHISTARELQLLSDKPLSEKKITAEVTPAHLIFCDKDYEEKGARIKCNPAIKTQNDRDALREALRNGKIDLIGTDHAPHLPEEKTGGALKATSGMPSMQFTLPAMLRMVDEGIFTIEQIVEKMCHAPAEYFKIDKRGYIRKNYYADLVLIAPNKKWTVTRKDILSQCKWSPFEGETFNWKVCRTWVNGECVYNNGTVNDNVHGKALKFLR